MSLRSALVAMIEEIDRILDESKSTETKPCTHKVSQGGGILFDDNKKALMWAGYYNTWRVDGSAHFVDSRDKYKLVSIDFNKLQVGDIFENSGELRMLISENEYACLARGRGVKVRNVGNLEPHDTYKLTAKEY